jgi:HSP20 family protein
MSLARWDPFTELRRMREDLDRFFGAGPSTTPVSWMGEVAMPPIDVFEHDNNIMVKANLPGLKKDDITITATDDSISVSGEFKREEEIKEGGFFRRERQLGKFFRTIPMPSAINPDQVKASFKDGVLEIAAPKAEAEKPKEKMVPVES